jgi:glutaredoxin
MPAIFLLRACFTSLFIAANGVALPHSGIDHSPDYCPGLDSFFIGGCCKTTLDECLQKTPPCPLAVHLGTFASWIDTLLPVESCSTRVAAIAVRYAFFTDTTHSTIDSSTVSFVGFSSSPVSIVLYVSALCPLCKRVYKGLYADVTEGSLHGIARLGIKVLSTRPWDLALLAARRVNKQSALFLSLAEVEERISMPVIRRKATEIGLSPAMMDHLTADSMLLWEANFSASEAARNGVTVTPTVFINGRRYRSYKDPLWIADAVLFMHETGVPSRRALHGEHAPEDR